MSKKKPDKGYMLVVERRRSNAAGTHDHRPNRLRTRKAQKDRAIKEQTG